MPAQAQMVGIVGNDSQRNYLRQAERLRFLPEIQKRSRLNALHITPIGQQVNIKAEDFVFRTMHFQLKSPETLYQLIEKGSFAGFEHAGNLHGNGGGSGYPLAMTYILP